jgi:hypothetical protein
MTIATLAAVVLASLGLISAVVFGVHTKRHLAQVLKTPPLATPRNANAADPADDVPTMRFKGQAFESQWQGSRGYESPESATDVLFTPGAPATENWTDRLIVPIVTPLRPSRFSDREYWTRYLPGVLALRALIFYVLPLLIVLLQQPANGAAGTFVPTSAQRAVPAHSSDYVADPASCGSSTSAASTSDNPIFVNYVDDGTVFSAGSGSRVIISYYYGKPVFSPDVPLCVPTTSTIGHKSGAVEYQVTGSGTGYVYIPQPSGTIVAEIQVPQNDSALVFVILGLTLAVVCYDITILIRLRRATQARYTATTVRG